MSDRKTLDDKLERLLELGNLRKKTVWPGYTSIGDYHGGVYESDFVSPYSKSACNVNASLMILLQDWASADSLEGAVVPHKRDFGYTPWRRTNINLFRLLKTHFALELKDTFATNVFPFVKAGSMSGPIPPRDMVRAAREFAIPQIDVIEPLTVVCLGKAAFNGVAGALERKRVKNVDEGINSPFLYRGAEIWCQAHTGTQGQNMRNRGGIPRVEGDWAEMAKSHRSRSRAL